MERQSIDTFFRATRLIFWFWVIIFCFLGLSNHAPVEVMQAAFSMGNNGDTAVAPSTTPFDKWQLWADGVQLRGANIYQRRVYPELDGPTFLGPGPVGPPYSQEDFDQLADKGANVVVISHPGLFSENPPYILDSGIQANLDTLLTQIAAADMFAIISFRTGPGRSEFTFFWSEAGTWFDESYLNDNVWQDQAAQDAWVAMWQYTAQRYHDNPIVVGYDLMVEPNSNEVGSHPLQDPLHIWDPEQFFTLYGDTLYDWNQLYPPISLGIRAVDAHTPLLIGSNAYGQVDWLPYLQPTGDTRTIYTVHQYAPTKYTHQWWDDMQCPGYPGWCDVDWDGNDEWFDQTWLSDYVGTPVAQFKAAHGVPVAVAEFGLVRWVPDGDAFMRDQMNLFEQKGLNYALWVWDPAWPEWAQAIDAFNFRHGPDPAHHFPLNDTPLENAITAAWSGNRLRPSTVIDVDTAVTFFPILIRN